MLYGQEMNVLVPVSSLPNNNETYLTITAKYRSVDNGNEHDIKIEASKASDGRNDKKTAEEVEVHAHRVSFINLLRSLMSLMACEHGSEARGLVEALSDTIKKSNTAENPFIIDLLQDLEGQVTEAISKQVFIL